MMFKTKQEVDKHVSNSLKRINNEVERNLRCLTYAKLYFSVADYEQTVRYAQSYISVKPKAAEGYCLLGKALERLNKTEAAIDAFKTSLQLDSKQHQLILKVCELLSQDDISGDKDCIRYFCNLAESHDPNNPIISDLKEKLILSESKTTGDISQFLVEELENRPTDVTLRVKLLKHFLSNNMVREAYKHAFEVEQKKLGIFDNSIAWYETFAEILVRYQKDSSQLNWEFWFLSAAVLEKLAALSLNDHADRIMDTTDYVKAVFNFDQSFLKVSQSVDSCPDQMLLKEFLRHYEGQLSFHLTVLAFKQAKKDLMTFKEVQSLVLPMLFIAYNLPVPDLQSVWFNSLTEKHRLLVAGWHKEASFRCSQAGNVLQALARERRNIVLDKTNQYLRDSWREPLFKKIFVMRDQQLKAKTSFFVNSVLDPLVKLPDYKDLIRYNEVAQTIHPSSLHHYIWLALNYQDLADFTLTSFEGLQYSVKNLTHCSAESLNVLDIQSFIYCATLCAQVKIKSSDGVFLFFNHEKPSVLPVSISGNFGTSAQAKFLAAAYRMFKQEYSTNVSEIRATLIKGIEVVRCIGTHGLDVKLLVNLASIFADRGKKLSKPNEVEANLARAELYYKTALPLLEKLKNNHAVGYPNNRLFEYKSNKEMTPEEIYKCIESANLFIGTQLMKKQDYEKAMQLFEGLKDPYASYYQSQIYKNMADSKTHQSKENVTSEMRSQNIILLSRARDCLYLTLDRLREPYQDRDHPLNAKLGNEIEKIERLLSRIDPDCTNRDNGSDDNISDNSEGEHYLSTYTHHTSFQNGREMSKNDTIQLHSTPLRHIQRQEARPSPERLDAQLRQLMASKDIALNTVLEQNKMMVELQKSLTEEIRGFKDAVNRLTCTVDERAKMFSGSFEDVKKMVDDLTQSVDDRMQNITDMVHELRRELNEIKKDNKNAQLSVEDLYDLDPDYQSQLDYNLPNISNTQQSNLNLYPNYRLPHAPQPNIPPMFPGQPPMPWLQGYPGLYPYGIGLTQPGFGLLPQEAQQQLAQLQNIPPVYPHLVSHTSTGPKDSPAFSTAAAGFGVTSSQAAPTNLPKQPSFGAPASVSFSSSFLGQSLTSTTTAVAATNMSSKAPPVNVVITSSDPLPTFKPTTTPVLSVMIPPQHIKGNVQKPIVQSQPASSANQIHNYHIPLAVTSSVATTPSVLSQPAPVVVTQSLLSNVPSPAFSAIAKSPPKNVSLGIEIEKALDKTFATPDKNTSLNKSNVSTSSMDEYDPRPDFQPIVPLPDEVPVTTGEEKETELFCQRAKLFRLAVVGDSKEWKERGIGNIKILLNPETNRVRLVMRREQVHKICANHFLTEDMVLTPMANNDRAYIWAANDFADEELVVEKFCARFKTAEEAKKFAEEFNDAKGKKPSSNQTANLGGFKFVSTPTFLKEEPKPTAKVAEPAPQPSPFAGFSFGAKATPSKNLFENLSPFTPTPPKSAAEKEEEDDFVPTAEFKPVLDKLPDVVEVKTGEENAEVLFEEKSKLFRLDTSGEKSEWKERGVGFMKILKDGNIRLIMRRDQVHKVCLNHQVLKTMTFKKNATDPKSVMWHAQDFSDGVLKPETFTARFKNEDIANSFFKILQSNQTSMDENNQLMSGKHHKPDTSIPKVGFGDKFKAAKGSWECRNCYIVNDGKTHTCVACDTPKAGTTPKKEEPTFSFSVKPSSDANTTEVTVTSSGGWGSQFKPASGSWECKMCYVTNSADKTKCISCETAKDGSAAASGLKGISLDTGGQTFSFGVPAAQNKSEAPVQKFTFSVPQTDKKEMSGFGDSFKPKMGTWECKSCYIRNEPSSMYCLSCETPKDGTVAPKEQSGPKGINLDTPGLKFNFGMPAATSFSFAADSSKTSFSWKPADTIVTSSDSKDDKFIFGSPQKHDFDFKPRSPRRISTGQGDESDASYVEDEEPNVYFKPVVPLPDIVEVKTGEEHEQVLYSHRAKLFRFVDGEWKERGLGDVKILKDGSTGKLRVVMRREQVHKICLNHLLTKDVEYKAKDEKTWLFHAADYSEGEISRDQFCLRFKTPEVAEKFKNIAEDALNGVEIEPVVEADDTRKKVSATEKEDSSSDVEFISETKVTPEEEAEALKLMLPPKFMSYRQRPDCTCEQCKKDDVFLKELFIKPEPASITSTSTSIFATPSIGTPSTAESVFQSAASSQFSFGTPAAPSSDEKLLSYMKNYKEPLNLSTASMTLKVTDETSKTPSGAATPTFSFGGAQKTVFGQKPENLFGTTSSTTNVPSSSIFGAKPVLGGGDGQKSLFNSSASIFGGNSSNTSLTNLFQSPKSTNIFGNVSKSSNNSIFASSDSSSSASNIFANESASNSSTNIFNTPSKIFGNTSKSSGIFGQTLFGSKSEPKITDANLSFGGSTTTNLKETDEVVLKADSNVTFATLAAQASPKAEPAFAKKDDEGSPFAFLGAGAPVFGAKKQEKSPRKSDKHNKTQDEDSGNEEVEGGDHDPHFEPIVPLPDQIVVSTGEEDEQVLFNERAKLFRYDSGTKEWKERGVGQFKVLFHPANQTYRLLLRREQVHKIVLNQRITADLDLQPMATSDKAWIWAGMNYCDDETKLEQLAVRFKNQELALAFKNCMDETLKTVVEVQANKSAASDNGLPTSVRDFAVDDGESNQEEQYEDEEEDDYEDRSIMFTKRCTLSEETPEGFKPVALGDLQVYYDSKFYATRISVTADDGELISNTMIGVNTVMDISGKECWWKAVEWAGDELGWRTLKATFSSEAAANEFHSNYLEGLNYAQEVGVVDELPGTDSD